MRGVTAKVTSLKHQAEKAENNWRKANLVIRGLYEIPSQLEADDAAK